jgi:adenylosuccinate lyase
MAGAELVTEGFQEGQVGSTGMPHKMNTRNSERVYGLAKLLKMYADGASRIGGDQWEEGDVSCSAIRRVILADAFYASDGLCETILTIFNEMGAYPVVIEKEVDRYLPFLASTEILSLATDRGLGREEAHKIIKRHSVSTALRMRVSGLEKNDLAINIANEPIFLAKGICPEDINAILLNRSKFIGNAERQIKSVAQQAGILIQMFPKAAAYEPRPIL